MGIDAGFVGTASADVDVGGVRRCLLPPCVRKRACAGAWFFFSFLFVVVVVVVQLFSCCFHAATEFLPGGNFLGCYRRGVSCLLRFHLCCLFDNDVGRVEGGGGGSEWVGSWDRLCGWSSSSAAELVEQEEEE